MYSCFVRVRLTSAGLKGFLRSFASWGTTQGVLWKAAKPIDRQISARTQARRILRRRRAPREMVVMGDAKSFAQTRGGGKTEGQVESSDAAEDQPEKLGIKEKDRGGNQPGYGGCESRIHERPHFPAVAGEERQRDHGERQLETEYDLAEDQERSKLAFAGDADNENRGENRNQASDEPANPGLQTDVQEPFHHDLPGERAGKRGILSGSEKRKSEKRAGEARA